MYKAEEFANLARNEKLTWRERIFYFFLLRTLRKSAKKGYEGRRFYYCTIIPKIRNMLEKEKFVIKEKQKDEDNDEYTVVRWINDEDEEDKITDA